MGPNGRRRLKRFAASTSIAIAATSVAGMAFGPLVCVIVGSIGFLAVAAVSDDGVGTCLIFAVLFLIILTLVIMALVGTVMINTS